MRISVVIPCLRDHDAVVSRVSELSASPHCHEIIVADATEGFDGWECEGATVVRCAEAGRGKQLNEGAVACSGDVLLFNHADTELTDRHLFALATELPDDVVGGAFFKDIRRHHPRLGWSEPLVRWFSGRYGILYGDQSIFVRRLTFEALHGFAPMPLMEDVDFSDRLRREGKVRLLDPPLQTSMRRFRRRGYLKNRAQNVVFVWLFRSGITSPETLYRWYYGG